MVARRVVSFASIALVVLAVLAPRPAFAQSQPNCTNCGGDSAIVYVTPDGTPMQAITGAAITVPFIVHNIGLVSDTYTLTCVIVGGHETCGTVSPSSLTLAPESTATVNVSFTPGATGTSGTVQLDAVGTYCNGGGPQSPGGGPRTLAWICTYATDSGTYNVTNVAGFPPTAVALRNQNGDNWDRDNCLASGGGEAAAWECGDLIVTHGLPEYSTMGHERSLTLLYNSATAAPHPVIAVSVTEPNGYGAPTTVLGELLINGVLRDSASYTGWGTAPLVRQMALSYDASGDTSGVYPFTIIVQNRYSGGAYADTLSGNLFVVNRSQSQFGAGWSLVGVERLYFNQPTGASNGSLLWIGGDGSAKLYAPAGTNKWVAPAGEYRDTIYYNTGSSTYTDTLRHKIVVSFDASGRHTKTTNRVGHSSAFYWNATTGRLDSIAVAPVGVAGTTYKLAYDGNGKLDKITDPANRVLDATVASNRLTSLLDPDTNSTGFGYDAAGRMIARTTRRGFTTRYAYANGVRVTIDSVRVDTLGASAPAYAVTIFRPWDEQGLAIGTSGQTAVDTALAYTKIDGPRTDAADTAEFWVDRWGAPTKIVNPLGGITTVVRGNATVPALVTQVTEADGRIATLTWDALGNLLQQRDSTSHLGVAGLPTRATRWTYSADSTKFSPDSEVDSTETGALVTHFVYNRWGLLRDVTAPNGHVTHFDFVTGASDSGLVQAVTELQVTAWDTVTKGKVIQNLRTAFAFNSLGNVVSDTSPMGHLTRYIRDGTTQRVTDVYDPGNHRVERVYDALNRVVQVKQHVESFDSGYAAPLVTTFHYAVDVLDSVSDPRGVVRKYRYDAADRRTKEIDDYGQTELTFYDPAGLVDSAMTRLSNVVRFTYDAGGRTTKQAWPALATVGADSVLFTYDVMGRLLTATTAARKVARTYFAVGAVKSEVQSAAAGNYKTTLTYAYDRLGRRIAYVNGVPGDQYYSDSIWYHYLPGSG